tara:strand:+ start:232 stop:618 length:387 start_codon:yes stop_codon:yes gene_type:complete
MAVNQLFKTKPTIDIIIKICSFFGIDLNNIDKKNSFTKKELEDINLQDNFNEIKLLLTHFYLPCKTKIYLENITIKKCITILRQILKLYNYTVISCEHYNNSKKYIVYTIKYNISVNNTLIDGIINFD